MKRSTTLLTNTINRSKKLALMIAFLLTAAVSYSFAANIEEVKVSGEIKTAFHKDFKNGQIIGSQAHKNFTKLTFRMNEIILFAYYSETGELLAVTRNILSTQLPIALQINLKNDYSKYWITELFEINGEGQNCYYVSLENADTKMTLRSTGDDNWEVYERSDKK